MTFNRIQKIFSKADRVGEVLTCFLTTPQWFWLLLAYLNIKPLTYPYQFTTRKGEKIILTGFFDLVTVWIIFFRKEYPIPQFSKVIIDAGSNIGSFSIYASRFAVDKIFAIEPFPPTFEQLKNNISLNNLDNKIALFQIALSGNNETRRMDLSPGPSQSRGLLANTVSGGLDVPALTLERFLTTNGIQKVDLLKIDIEGGEYDVFNNCQIETFNRINEIVMEYHPTGSKESLFRRLTDHGFTLKKEIKFNHASGVAHFIKV